MSDELVLIDLSSIAHPIWHMSQSDPNPNHASQQIVARVRALANGHPHVAICCDSGKSFRHDIAPSYKANRPEAEAPLHHQIDLAKDTLAADGFPIWAVRGFEADDVIATATACAVNLDRHVLIVSADKDLLQLVGPKVTAQSARDGSRLDDAAVFAKLGVRPDQVRDYLTLVGDASDNVKGMKGVGQKRAAELLAKFKTVDALYDELRTVGQVALGLTPSMVTAIKEFEPHLEQTRKLITLRTDAIVPFDEILAERTPKDVTAFSFDPENDDMDHDPLDAAPPSASSSAGDGSDSVQPAAPSPQVDGAGTSLVVRDAEILPAPKEWERGLDPRSMKDARILAKDMFDSRMFSAYGTPQAVLSTVMVGRELGLPAMASLRCIHVIEGKHGLAASLMVALVLRSGLAEYFEPISFSETEATYETKRKGARNPVKLTHTFDMAVKAWPKSKKEWQQNFDASGWGRNPTDMLVARATSRLARMVYPDLLSGLYTPEELAEIRE